MTDGADEKERKITPKQEAFALAYFETGNAAEAYRRAYDVSPNARDEWIYVEASRLVDDPRVALRLVELREHAEKLSIYTRHKAMEELEQARMLALNEGQAGSAVSATTAKVKLLGIDKPQRVAITDKDGNDVEYSDPTEKLTELLSHLRDKSVKSG